MNNFKSIKLVGAIVALSMLLMLPNALAQSPEHGQAINTMCPITPEEEVDPAFTIEYEGQTIGFCCRKCRTRFDEDPEAYLAELPMLQTVSMTTNSEPSHDDEHDHAVDHDKGKSGLAKFISWLGKFHPPATHLPIGMLIGAALAEGLFIMTKRDMFRHAGAFCVVIAGFGALAAVTLGWFNGGFTLVDDQWVQTVHRWLGTSTTLLTLLSVGLLFRASRTGAKPSARLSYRVSLFTAAGMIGATGFFGGALVYGLNHYQW